MYTHLKKLIMYRVILNNSNRKLMLLSNRAHELL